MHHFHISDEHVLCAAACVIGTRRCPPFRQLLTSEAAISATPPLQLRESLEASARWRHQATAPSRRIATPACAMCRLASPIVKVP